MLTDNIFLKILNKQIPAKVAYEDDGYIVIHDIQPQAPVHVLVIPKRQIATLNDLEPADAELVGGMFLVAKKVMTAPSSADAARKYRPASKLLVSSLIQPTTNGPT